MAAGLQCWNSAGQINFDSTINTTRVIGNFNTGTSNGSRIIPDSEIAGGRLWYMVNYTNNNMSLTNDYVAIIYPILKISGNTISWQFNEDTYGFSIFWDAHSEPSVYRLSVNVLYGVY